MAAKIVLLVLLAAAGSAAQTPDQAWDTTLLVREAGALDAADLPALEQRANAGDGRAQVLLGLANEMGSAGLKPDAVAALNWLKRAVDQRIAWAEMWTGDFYYTGSNGVPKDLYEAMRLYQLSAEHGNPRAAFFVGRMYFFGEGVRTNHEEAARWFRRSRSADPAFVDRMVALAEIPCQSGFCVTFRQLVGATMAQLTDPFVGDWDDTSREWESLKDLPGFFEKCGFTSSNRTADGEVENYFCDTEPIVDADTGNRTAKQLADDVAMALPPNWTRTTEARAGGSAYFFTQPDYPKIRVSYNATQGKAYQRVTVLIGR